MYPPRLLHPGHCLVSVSERPELLGKWLGERLVSRTEVGTKFSLKKQNMVIKRLNTLTSRGEAGWLLCGNN